MIASGKINELGKKIVSEGHYVLEIEVEPCDDRFLGFIGTLDGVKKVSKEGDRFIIESDRDLRKQITEFLGVNHYTLLHLRQKGGDLDEIYRVYFEQAEEEEAKHVKSGKEHGNRKKA